MKYIKYLILISLIFSSLIGFSQEKYFVFLKDKSGSEFNPLEYFDGKAIERRIKNNIPINDISDYPVSSKYVKSVSEYCESTGFESRWLNMIVISAYPHQVDIIRDLEFVTEVEKPLLLEQNISEFDNNFEIVSSDKDDLLLAQTESMGREHFEKANLNGNGVRIAVFDVGFQHVDTHRAFSHIRDSGRILKTWDFVDDEENVYKGGTHGRSVFSCIAGLYDGKKIGLATQSEFILARTEYSKKEPAIEEEFWLAAAEWADKNGVEIINSSLGYTKSRYFPFEMNGETSLVSRAARIAARKGILVVSSMGNDGTNDWRVICTPADADSVLSIGGINYKTGYRTDFSSYGPTADRRRKPNVSAYGYVMAAAASGINKSSGTSFSSPLVAGFAACVLQHNPNLTNMELFELIEKSGNLYPYYDYSHGYGIPQAGFIVKGIGEVKSTFELTSNEEVVNVRVDTTTIDSNKNNLLYYHIENPNGVLEKYSVIDVYSEEVLTIRIDDLKEGQTLRVHYAGVTKEFKN